MSGFCKDMTQLEQSCLAFNDIKLSLAHSLSHTVGNILPALAACYKRHEKHSARIILLPFKNSEVYVCQNKTGSTFWKPKYFPTLIQTRMTKFT